MIPPTSRNRVQEGCEGTPGIRELGGCDAAPSGGGRASCSSLLRESGRDSASLLSPASCPTARFPSPPGSCGSFQSVPPPRPGPGSYLLNCFMGTGLTSQEPSTLPAVLCFLQPKCPISMAFGRNLPCGPDRKHSLRSLQGGNTGFGFLEMSPSQDAFLAELEVEPLVKLIIGFPRIC